jgi:N-acetylglucosamine-6-phosphate deacetylase
MYLAAERVFTGDAVLTPGWVEVAGTTVSRVGSGEPPQPAEHQASWLAPGLVDVHCHGGGGASFDQADDAATATALRPHQERGTTTTIASLVTASTEDLVRQVTHLAGWVERGALAGIHLEGPWLAPERKGAHDEALLTAPTEAVITEVLAAGRGTIRMVTLAPELPGAEAATRQFTEAGVVVAVGHTAADYDTTVAALSWGARGATHLFNAMPPLNHRNPGPILALLRDPAVWLELIADGVHVDAELVAWTLHTYPERVVLITDAMAAAGFGDGDYLLGKLAVEVRDGVARLTSNGAIAGSTLILAHAVEKCFSLGLPAEQVLAAATVQPADYLGLDVGRLQAGRSADLVLTDDRLRVLRTLRQGRWVGGDDPAR